MRLTDNKRITKESYADLGVTLYRVNDEIYDEINFRDNKYYVVHRCGTEPFSLSHNHSVYFTDMKTIVYPLEPIDVWEEEIDAPPIKTFGEYTAFSVNRAECIAEDIEVEVDHRYIEEYRQYIGNEIEIEDDGDEETSDGYVTVISNDAYTHTTSSAGNAVNFPRCFTFNGITEKVQNKLTHLGEYRDGAYHTGITSDFQYSDASDWYWKMYQFESCDSTLEAIKEREPIDHYVYHLKDLNGINVGRILKNDYTLYMYTYVYFPDAVSWTPYFTITGAEVEGARFYVNGELQQTSQTSFNKSMAYNAGWNLIEIVIRFKAKQSQCGIVPYNGWLYSKYIEFRGGATFNTNYKLSCYPRAIVGDVEIDIVTENPFRSVGNISDRFARVNIDKPHFSINATALQRGFTYVNQRRIGVYTLTGEEGTSFTIEDASTTNNECISDLLSENQVSINGGFVTITLEDGDSIENYIGAQIQYVLQNDVFEPILNQLEVAKYLENIFYEDPMITTRSYHLTQAPTNPVTFPTEFGTFSVYKGKIFNTRPGNTYAIRRPGTSSTHYTQRLNNNYPTCIELYDKNLNVIKWVSWGELVGDTVDESNSNKYLWGRYVCPENVYAIGIVDSLYNSARENILIDYVGSENLFNMEEWYNGIGSYTGEGTHSFEDGTLTITSTSGTYYAKSASSTYNIPLKPKTTYIFTYEAEGDLGSLVVHRYKSPEATSSDATLYGSSLYYMSKGKYVGLVANNTAVGTVARFYFTVADQKSCKIKNAKFIEVYNAISNDDTQKVLHYQIDDGEIQTLNLPVALQANRELVYYPERGFWKYVGQENGIVSEITNYYEDQLPPIPLKKGQKIKFIEPYITMQTAFDYRHKRELAAPTDIVYADEYKSGENGYGYIKWHSVIGATEYRIVVNGEVIKIFDGEYDVDYDYQFQGELRGKVYIEAWNDLGMISKTREYDLETIPAAVEIDSFDTNFENNRYYIDVKFRKLSKTADAYLLFYSLDGGNYNVIKYPNDGSGDEVTEQIVITGVSNNISFRLIPTNETGDNDLEEAIDLLPTDGFDIWTYRESAKQILCTFYDDFEDEDYYNIKYRINGGDWNILQVDGAKGTGTRLIEYLDLQPDEEMDMCLAPVRKGYSNIYSKPITVSRALDHTLVPPKQFKGVKLQDGQIQFTWLDDYKVDSAFDLYYTYSDGTSATVRIDQDLDYGSYVYTTENYGFINARVRMVWEFGQSAYTDFIIVYNIPIVEEAPSINGKNRDEQNHNKLIIRWEQYDFVKNYTVYFAVDGIENRYTVEDNQFVWEIPQGKQSVAIACRVQATYIDGTDTTISDSLSYNVVNDSFRERTIIYGRKEVEDDFYTTIYSQNLKTNYDVYTYSMNHYDTPYSVYLKRYEPDVLSEYLMYESYWGKGIGSSHLLHYDIINKYGKSFRVGQIQYSNIKDNYNILASIYINTTSEYRVYSEFVKMVICCLGDSITAGRKIGLSRINKLNCWNTLRAS